ncbi:MAG: adenine phosphoribosyltransferase [Candidatus Omnitrophota bacterium]|nr:MAG: adenine phosphoribosyltransferase [Candidatus Omnitrophota bacterium]
MEGLKQYIRSIPDFPKKGILFRDITTLLKNPAKFKQVIDVFYDKYKDKKIEAIVAAEARGFILGGALAYKLDCAFVPVRKKGKLPAGTIEATYELEYGTDTICMHKDAIKPKERVLILDDLLATGGTAKAMCDLVGKTGGDIVGIAFMIELCDLKGRDKIKEYDIFTLITY